MRGLVRGFLIGALLPFDIGVLMCLGGHSLVWALYLEYAYGLPCAMIGALLGGFWGAWEESRDYLGTATSEMPRTLPLRSKATSKP